MLQTTQPDTFEVIAAGVDWITATAKSSENAMRLDRLCSDELSRQVASGYKVVPHSRLGFSGSKGEHIFFGRREHDVIVQVGSHLADDMLAEIIPLASNVSRLDMQVTVWTNGTVVQLADMAWHQLNTLPPGAHRPRSYNLYLNHPAGQTLYLNSRKSDNFGRLYDKGVETKLAPAGLVWRYECELKRHVALQRSREVAAHKQRGAIVSDLVHSWWTERGVPPAFPSSGAFSSKVGRIQDPDHSVLTWFDEKLSKTVAAAVVQYGPNAVLKSLHLQKHFQVKGE